MQNACFDAVDEENARRGVAQDEDVTIGYGTLRFDCHMAGEISGYLCQSKLLTPMLTPH